jgi:ubiquinone/menaquinone biosynthesis C-methylase UbiE
MVQAAQSRATGLALENVDCRVLDAEQLPLPDQEFDGVLCRWGYMLMQNAAAAFAETRRVLRPNGRLCCAVFASPEHNPWAAVPIRVLQERRHLPPPHAGAPGIFALADRPRLIRLFTEAGFREPQIDEMAFSWRFDDTEDYWAFLTTAAGAIATVFARIDDKERERVREDITTQALSYCSDHGISLPALSLVATA